MAMLYLESGVHAQRRLWLPQVFRPLVSQVSTIGTVTLMHAGVYLYVIKHIAYRIHITRCNDNIQSRLSLDIQHSAPGCHRQTRVSTRLPLVWQATARAAFCCGLHQELTGGPSDGSVEPARADRSFSMALRPSCISGSSWSDDSQSCRMPATAPALGFVEMSGRKARPFSKTACQKLQSISSSTQPADGQVSDPLVISQCLQILKTAGSA